MKKVKYLTLFLALLLIFLMCSCSSPAEKDPETVPRPDEGSSDDSSGNDSENNSSPVQKITVGELINEHGEYKDDVGNTYNYSYSLPLIEGNTTAYTEKINSDMRDILSERIEPEKELMETGASLITLRIGYEVFGIGNEASEIDDIISLFIYIDSDWDMSEYFCYNLTADGSAVSNARLLELKGVSEDEFLTKARELMGEMVDFDDTADSFFLEVRDKTLSGDNINVNTPMYTDADGTLCFIGKVYSVAGAEYYYHIFDTGL